MEYICSLNTICVSLAMYWSLLGTRFVCAFLSCFALLSIKNECIVDGLKPGQSTFDPAAKAGGVCMETSSNSTLR